MKKFLALLLASFFFAFLVPGSSSAVTGGDWKPGRIIDDSIFFNKGSMSVSQIQAFLSAKVPVCDKNRPSPNPNYQPPYTCLKDYVENPNTGVSNYGKYNSNGTPKAVSGGKTAAQIIWDAAQEYDINPQALLVMLQKEQSLITDDWPWIVQYQKAMGQSCPDTAPCDPAFAGFYNQVSGAAWQLRHYVNNPQYFNYRANTTRYVLYNPNSSCGGTNVYIENAATAALYNYTPYQPNAAALNNLYGTGNSCSAYGNRNFWRLFNDWFGNTDGTPFFRINGGSAVYILGSENNYYHATSYEALEAYGYPKRIKTIANYGSSHISGRTNSGSLPIIARFEAAQVYLLDDGYKYHFTSEAMMNDHGHSMGSEATLPAESAIYFPGTSKVRSIVKNKSASGTYMMENGERRHFVDMDAYNSGDPAYSSLPKVLLSKDYIDSRVSGTPIIGDDKLIKINSGSTHGFWDGDSLWNITNSAIKKLGLAADHTLSAEDTDELESGDSIVNMLAKDSDNNLYILDTKKKLRIPNADLASYGLNVSDFLLMPSEFLARIPTRAMKPLVTIDGEPGIYYIKNGELLRFNSYAAIDEYGEDYRKAESLNARSARLFPYNKKKILASGTLYRINNTKKVYLVTDANGKAVYVPSKELLDHHGLAIENTINANPAGVTWYADTGTLAQLSKDAAGKVWLSHSGGKRNQLSAEQLSEARFNISSSALNTLSSRIYRNTSNGGVLKNLLRSTDSSRIYYVQNGEKRWVLSVASMSSLGYGYNDIGYVNKSFLDSLPNGPKITD